MAEYYTKLCSGLHDGIDKKASGSIRLTETMGGGPISARQEMELNLQLNLIESLFTIDNRVKDTHSPLPLRPLAPLYPLPPLTHTHPVNVYARDEPLQISLRPDRGSREGHSEKVRREHPDKLDFLLAPPRDVPDFFTPNP
ncbi:hypothetical protein RRG08_005912 [Elysia crispata]|uniref:Uncharacterized protein n=1 Tax=Elysia crispata TaxID=231223 RepID=A0AAE0Y512_9GAST|nr:hypothetical protein RRG08_005912 [Elysia crispata]